MFNGKRKLFTRITFFGMMMFFATGCVASNDGEEVETTNLGKEPTKPNIILIMADDLGYGDLSSYGHPTIQTPIIDGLAKSGLRLTSFYSGDPVCTPSRAALMTGRYAIRSNMTGVEFPDSDHGIPPSEITLAEALREQSYQTAMVGKWHLGDRSPHLPTENGFDSYYGLLYSNDMIEPWISTEMEEVDDTPPPLMLVRNTEPVQEVKDQGILTKAYTKEAVQLLGSFETGNPFFLYLAYTMPHVPVAAPEEFRGKSKGGLYGDVIQAIDWSVGEIISALEKRGELDNTIIVFTSDNGPWHNMPARMVQNGIEPWHVGSTGTLRGSKGTTYEGGLRVPAVVHWPNSTAVGKASSELVSAVDIFTTLAKAGGAEFPKKLKLDGKDLSKLFAGETNQSVNNQFFYFKGKRLEGVRDSKWKLRVSRYTEKNLPRGGGDGVVDIELFNLEEDPSERFEVSDRYPEQVNRLRVILEKFAAETGGELALKDQSK